LDSDDNRSKYRGGSKEITLNASGLEDVFIAMYSPSGELILAHNMGGNSSDIGFDISAVDDEVYVHGIFRGTMDVDLDSEVEFLLQQ